MICYQTFLYLRLVALSTLLLATALTAGCGNESASHEGHDHAAHSHGTSDPEPSAAAILAAHEHEEPSQTCFMCDASKRDEGRLWCKEHVRYEDRCWLCHPELEDKDRLYCKEHFLYEDECHLCHPELKSGDETTPEAGDEAGPAASATPAPGGLFCREHGVYEMECGICQPDLASSMQPGQNLKIRFPSARSADKAGVRIGQPQSGEATPTIEALCEVQYNLNAMARVTPLADGVIRKVRHDVGDRVEAGDVLVELHSAQVAESKSDYLSALVQRETGEQAMARQERLRDQNIAAEKDLLEAQALHRSATLQANNLRQRLVNLGFTDDEIEAVEREQDTSATLSVRAPFGGTLVERDAVIGESVATGEALFTVADMSKRWLMLSIPARYLTQVGTGQSVVARFDDLPGVEVRGEITWIDSSVDPRSRLIKARAVVFEDADRIKTGLFGRVKVMTGDTRPATIVPRDSVQQHLGKSFVFVRDEADLFSLRNVALGQANGQTVEVLAGLTAADPIVTDGSFVVMSEFLKSRLGAGCAHH